MERVAKCAAKYNWSPIVWKDGYRHGKNFVQANLCGLDFDDNDMTLEEAKKAFCDMRHVIGTTKSHQIWKGEKPPCDRFRVVLEFTAPITNLRDYRYTMEAIRKRYPVDQGAVDGARLFHPCTEIVSVDNSPDLMTEDVLVDDTPASMMTFLDQVEYQIARKGRLPPHVEKFLDEGVVFGGGRYRSCYIVAIYLLALKMSPTQVRNTISSAPFNRVKFIESEIDRAIEGALNASSK